MPIIDYANVPPSSRPSRQMTIRFGGDDNNGSFYLYLFILFLILKLTHVINWSWWWVTCPLWAGVAIALTLSLLSIIITGAVTGVRAGFTGLLTVLTRTVGLILARPIMRWEAKQQSRIADRYAAREAREKSMVNHPAGKARVDLSK